MGAPQQAPLATISRLFSEASSSGVEPEQDFGVEQHFAAVVECGQQKVQETRDPEFYLGTYQLPGQPWKTGMYQDAASVDFAQVQDHKIYERRLLDCVPLQGLSAWATVGAPWKLAEETTGAAQGQTSQLKRGREVMEVADSAPAPEESDAKHARQSSQQGSGVGTALAAQLAAEEPCTCRVLVYRGGEDLKINDVVHVVGILSHSPEMEGQDPQDDCALQDEGTASPSRLVPRLHAILVKKLDARSMTSLMQPSHALSAAKQARQQALHLLRMAVGGDALVAEYLLLQLLARVHQRTDKLAVGALSINVTGCPSVPDAAAGQPSPLAAGLQAAMAALVPSTAVFPLSVPWLNGVRLRPKQEHATGRWQLGGVQLPPHTQLLVDETVLQSGRLDEHGINNLRVLKGVLDSQLVDYDCGFYQLPMPADLPSTVLSASTSLLKDSLDIRVPLQPLQDPVGPSGIAEAVAASDLTAARAFLAHMRHAEVALGPESASWVERSLQAVRETAPGSEAQTMHSWLTIARLLALSHGETQLKEEHWQYMRHLEHHRVQRQRIVHASVN